MSNMFEQFDDSVDLFNNFTIEWSLHDVGFGQFRFYNDEFGTLRISNECMSKESIKKVLSLMVDSAILDD